MMHQLLLETVVPIIWPYLHLSDIIRLSNTSKHIRKILQTTGEFWNVLDFSSNTFPNCVPILKQFVSSQFTEKGRLIRGFNFSFSRDFSDSTIHLLPSDDKFSASQKGLLSLNLNGCQFFTDAGAVNLSKKCHNLVNLEIYYNTKLTDVGLIPLIDSNQYSLQKLNLSGCKNITDQSLKVLASKCSHTLIDLNLTRTSLTTEVGHLVVCESLTKLKSLNLYSCHHLESTAFKGIAKLHHLEFLDLCGCSITNKEFVQICKNCLKIKSLNLTWCTHISDEGIKALGQSKHGGLHQLSLHGNTHITMEGFSFLIHSIHSTTLLALDIRGCTGLSELTQNSFKLLKQFFPNVKQFKQMLLFQISSVRQLVCHHLTQKRNFSRVGTSKQPNNNTSGPEPAYSVPKGYQLFKSLKPFSTTWRRELPSIEVAYETWGELNSTKSNAILLHTGLSASSHARSHTQNPEQGWWEEFIGPKKALDTNKFFVICCNNLGGCFGTTGPSSLDPNTGLPYASNFPFITVQDIVKSQFLLLDHLGVDNLHATIGSSLGGMESLAAASMFPHRISRMISISAAATAHPTAMAIRYTQRRALMNDPNFNKGNYYNGTYPISGMQLAREIATISYRSGPEWVATIGDEKAPNSIHLLHPTLDADYDIESYLHHQGKKWCEIYDPNSLIVLSKAMDLFTMEAPDALGQPCLKTGLQHILMPSLIMGSKSDNLIPISQQKEIADTLTSIGNKYVVYYELDTLYGHDTFLIDVNTIGAAVKGHLELTYV